MLLNIVFAVVTTEPSELNALVRPEMLSWRGEWDSDVIVFRSTSDVCVVSLLWGD